MLNIYFLDTDEYQFSDGLRKDIEWVVKSAEKEVRELLPQLAKYLNFTFLPSKKVIPETGEVGMAAGINWIQISINPWHQTPIEEIVHKEIRRTVFHEANHLTRLKTTEWGGTLIADAIFEGLGTVFERDFADGRPKWGEYDPSVIGCWTNEVLALDSEKINRQHWFFDHPDGRRWIAYRVGTYVVDQAIKNTPGENAATLVDRPAADILKMAKMN